MTFVVAEREEENDEKENRNREKWCKLRIAFLDSKRDNRHAAKADENRAERHREYRALRTMDGNDKNKNKK